jgi:hypothetical protein
MARFCLQKTRQIIIILTVHTICDDIIIMIHSYVGSYVCDLIIFRLSGDDVAVSMRSFWRITMMMMLLQETIITILTYWIRVKLLIISTSTLPPSPLPHLGSSPGPIPAHVGEQPWRLRFVEQLCVGGVGGCDYWWGSCFVDRYVKGHTEKGEI